MLIMLYTSRVVLLTLGVNDYGIYNVVGGVVSMFSIVSGTLSVSISRYITYELGREDKERLKKVFSTSINILLAFSLIVVLICETLGLWFLNCKMNIPSDRLYAANWVLQCSLFAFVVNLISIPYNADIVAHEKMNIFAYVSILDASLKLIIVLMLPYLPFDQLIIYSLLLLGIAIIIRLIYGYYCSRHFEESKYQRINDLPLVKEMTKFAGLSFFSTTAFVINTQGVNLLINLFFSVSVNAARGIASQVQGALIQFVGNFSTAISPQITKLYAAGNYVELYKLIIRGAKFTFFMFLFFSIPLFLEADYILSLWLKDVPDHTILFTRLTIIASMIDRLGYTSYLACMATGKIKKYALFVTPIEFLVFPLTYLAYVLGSVVEMTYIILIISYVIVDVIRVYCMKIMINFPIWLFYKEVVCRIVVVTVFSAFIPFIVIHELPQSFFRLTLVTIISVISVFVSVFYVGCTYNECRTIENKIHQWINRVHG